MVKNTSKKRNIKTESQKLIFAYTHFKSTFENSLGRTVLHIRLYDRWENVSYGGLTFSIVYCPLLILVRTFFKTEGVYHYGSHFLAFSLLVWNASPHHSHVSSLCPKLARGRKEKSLLKIDQVLQRNAALCICVRCDCLLQCGVDKLFQSMYVWQVTNIPQNHPPA